MRTKGVLSEVCLSIPYLKIKFCAKIHSLFYIKGVGKVGLLFEKPYLCRINWLTCVL